jgi:hypothetical protein
LAILLASSLPLERPAAPVAAQTESGGRVLAAARGQVAWLDLLAPRRLPLTRLVPPAYPADVAATSAGQFAVASVVSEFPSLGRAFAADLVFIDLQSETTRTLLARQTEFESLDLPAIWPDGSAILFQRSSLSSATQMPGQARAQSYSRIEYTVPDGSTMSVLLDDARSPAPSPDGARFAFVRTTDRGVGLFAHPVADSTEADQTLVAPGPFQALAYPRYSPDAQQVAFAGISALGPIGRSGSSALAAIGRPAFDPLSVWGLGGRPALAHGLPWEVWLVAADGTNLRAVPDLIADDPSVTWSPDGTQLLVYSGWGSFLVNPADGSTSRLPHLVGYGSVAWLSD